MPSTDRKATSRRPFQNPDLMRQSGACYRSSALLRPAIGKETETDEAGDQHRPGRRQRGSRSRKSSVRIAKLTVRTTAICDGLVRVDVGGIGEAPASKGQDASTAIEYARQSTAESVK